MRRSNGKQAELIYWSGEQRTSAALADSFAHQCSVRGRRHIHRYANTQYPSYNFAAIFLKSAK